MIIVEELARKLNHANSLASKCPIKLSLFGKKVHLDYVRFKDGEAIFVGCEPVGPKPGKRLGLSRPVEEDET